MMLSGFRRFLSEGALKVTHPMSQNTAGRHNDLATATYLPTSWTGTEDLGPRAYGLPGTDLEIPKTSRTSKVRTVEKNRSPIRVSLMDGTVLYLTLDEFRRIDSRTKLEPGREIKVTFQRRSEDGSPEPSKVISVE